MKMKLREMRQGKSTWAAQGALVVLTLLLAASWMEGQPQPASTPPTTRSEATRPSVAPTARPSSPPVTPAPAGGSTPPSGSAAPQQPPAPAAPPSTAGNWIAFAGAILVALIAGAFALYQLRKNVEAQRALEQQKQTWEREKLQFQQQLGLEGKRKEAELERELEEKEAAEIAARELQAQAERARTAEEHAAIYRQRLILRLKDLKILDMPSPLSLETVYVQLRVREEEPARYAREEEIRPLAEGEPAELLRQSQMRVTEGAAVAVAPEDALSRFRRIAVLGDPGAGKTTMLRHLALRMAQAAWSHLPSFPIYIELRRFVDSALGNLLDFAAADCAEHCGFTEGRPYLEQQLDSGKAAFLLDGLDEVLGGATPEEAKEAYDKVAGEVNRLAARFPEAPIAITCRRAGWRGGLTAFQNLEVLDFAWDQIQEFVDHWFATEPRKAEGLRRALEGNLRMQTLAANPLILSLIAIVYERELELPERRAELYHRCVEVLLREWDDHRRIKRFSQFTRDRKRDLLEEVAWHFHRSGRRYFPEADLLRLISSFLPTIHIQPEENKAILDEILAQYGLLKVQAHGWYGFLHLTLQEYFAALAANERGTAGLQEVVAHRHESWWEEVILLLAGRLADASPLLLGILGRPVTEAIPEQMNDLVPEGEPLAVGDDLFQSDLLLAGRCLAGTPRVRLHGLRERIITEVKQMLVNSVYELDAWRAARVLIEIDGDILTDELFDILEREPANSTAQSSIVESYGKLGDRKVAARLTAWFDTAVARGQAVDLAALEALASLKATGALPSMFTLLRARRETSDVTRIIRAIGAMGDKSVVPDLMQMLTDPESQAADYDRQAIARALARLGDKSVAPMLFHMLVDGKQIRLLPALAEALRDLKDESLMDSMLDQIQCPRTDWRIAWLLAVALEGLREGAGSRLAALLASPRLDKRVRVAVAATLGSWGVRASSSHLREAIENEIVPPSLVFQYGSSSSSSHTYTGYLWTRIVSVLKSLGDDTVVPALVRAYQRSVTKGGGQDPINRVGSEAIAILYAASVYKPEAIAIHAMGRLRQSLIDQRSSPLYARYLLQVLPGKTFVPELRDLLSKAADASHPNLKLVDLVSAIESVADDVDTVQALLKLRLRKATGLGDEIYRAIYAVSQRARVRVTSDGHVLPLSPPVSAAPPAGS